LHILCLCFVDKKAKNERRLRMVFVFFYICKLAREQKNDVDGIHGVVSEGDIKARAMG